MNAPLIYLALGRANRMVLEALEGQRVLESFAYVSGTACDRYRPTWKGAMADCGAYTELSQGVKIDLDEYIAFCHEHGAFYDVLVSLDDIRGDVAKSRANHQRMLDAGIRAMPVFHQGEPWSVLDEVCASAPDGYIGLGLQRPIQNARAWLDEVFSRKPSHINAHGFAMVAYLIWGYPFFSVDSSTWVHEWLALQAVKGQGADALEYLTPGELLAIVLKKYERIRAKTAWTRTPQGGLFEWRDAVTA